jgi:RNA polymerase sigma factor (sigma-70 family)
VTDRQPLGELLRDLTPQVLGALAGRSTDFAACEDAVQEALLAASMQWPADGWPENPRGWLITVAERRLHDAFRSESARRNRETHEAALAVSSPHAEEPSEETGHGDDTLILLFMCCHPALSPPSQLALTLRAVGGLTTAEIAREFMVPESTMAQRISRAKSRIRATGVSFRLPSEAERPDRLRVVLHVLYLVFTEGHTSTTGPVLHRAELTSEAIRLARILHRLLPDDGEVTGLLALMLLTDARRGARTDASGALVPLADQDRAVWDHAAIEEGIALISAMLGTVAAGPYQVQAAIAAIHGEARSAAETDWTQILLLYRVLDDLSPNPMTRLNMAVAAAMVDGPLAGLDIVAGVELEENVDLSHRIDAVRGHLLEMSGDLPGARTAYRLAAQKTMSMPEQRYLERQAARLERETE